MEDFNILYYVAAAVIYFLTRNKKKRPQKTSRPGTENTPPRPQAKSFEDLLKEITEGRDDEPQTKKEEHEPVKTRQEEVAVREEGAKRVFADDESRRVYEASIKMAEGADIAFERDVHFQKDSLLKQKPSQESHESIAEELFDGFDAEEAKKAVIYREILDRKYIWGGL